MSVAAVRSRRRERFESRFEELDARAAAAWRSYGAWCAQRSEGRLSARAYEAYEPAEWRRLRDELAEVRRARRAVELEADFE